MDLRGEKGHELNTQGTAVPKAGQSKLKQECRGYLLYLHTLALHHVGAVQVGWVLQQIPTPAEMGLLHKD